MAMVKCEYGHFYDNTQTSSCPYCADCKPEPITEIPKQIHRSAAPEPLIFDDIPEAHDDEPRIKIAELIIVNGQYKGKTFDVYDGITNIGSGSADIVLDFEPAISEAFIKVDNPYRIIYNKGHKQFYSLTTPFRIPGKHKGIAGLFFKKTSFMYKPIKGKFLSVLKNKDIIKIGKTKLLFRIICDL